MTDPKRAAHNRKKMFDFLSSSDRFERPRSSAATELTPELALRVIQLFSKNEAAMTALGAYARRFKQATGEITVEDVREVWDQLMVLDIHNS